MADMNTALLLARMRAEIETIKAERLAEIDAREMLAGYVDGALNRMYGTITDRAFLVRNGNALNVLQKSAGAVIDLVAAAGLNWNGTTDKADNTLLTRLITPGLIRTLATEALVSGKLAVFPMLKAGVPRLVAPAGYLRFLLESDASAGDAPEVETVVQVIPTRANGQPVYEVRVYSAGMVEIYPPVQDWADYLGGTPRQEPQSWAGQALPLAVAVARMNALRHPSGLVAETLPAFLRYLKTAIDRNAAQEIAGQPEGVLYSDFYLNLLTNPTDPRTAPRQAAAEAKALEAARTRGPRQLRVVATGDKYEIKPGVDVTPQILAEASDRRDVQEAFGDLESSGGDLSGVALAERRQRRTTLTEGLCLLIGDVLSRALDMLAGIPGSGVPRGVSVTLTPKFPQDTQARAEQVGSLYGSGPLPASAALKELQSAGWTSITDEMISQAEAREKADAASAEAMAASLTADLSGRNEAGLTSAGGVAADTLSA